MQVCSDCATPISDLAYVDSMGRQRLIHRTRCRRCRRKQYRLKRNLVKSGASASFSKETETVDCRWAEKDDCLHRPNCLMDACKARLMTLPCRGCERYTKGPESCASDFGGWTKSSLCAMRDC